MQIAWTPDCRGDRQAIYDYIEADNPAAAFAVDEMFARASSRLSSLSMSGRPGRFPGTRELVVHPSYVIIYDIAGEMIRILRILHTAQKWPPE